jgi:cytochrome c556
MNLVRSAILGIAVAGMAGSALLAASHGMDPAVKARQAHMTLLQHNLALLGNMAKGAVEFDAEDAQAAADGLHLLASIDQRTYWTEGTSADEVEGSRGLPAIWENMADYESKVEGLETATATMAEAAGTLDGVRANMNAVGSACGACHQTYRQPN